MRTWMQPSPKWPYGVPRRPWAASSARKSLQIRPQPGGRHRAVLPAGPGLGAVRHPRRRTARVLPDPPQRALPGRIGHHQRVEDIGSPHDLLRTRACRRLRLAAGLHEQPGRAPRQLGGGAARGRPPFLPPSVVRTAAGPPPPPPPRPRPGTPGRRAHARGAPGPTVRSPPSGRPACPPSRRRNGRRPRPSRAAARPGRSRRYGGAARGSRCAAGRARPPPGPAGPRAPPAHPCPSRSRDPPDVTTVSSRTPSAVVPQATECEPHELLPIIPPSVQRLCVEGSGPKRRPCGAAASWRRSSTSPGWTTAVPASGSRDSSRFMCRVKSRTTPVPVACPAIEVPPPRATTGTPCARQTDSTAATSSASRGATTPSGTRR